ncbi:MAG: bifunctional oligoribonuclease/PAP phosphatase NrnA [Patescibacteria group bacterium]
MVEFYPLFQKIKEEAVKARSAIVISHQNPDGDAIGSLLGMSYFLDQNEVMHELFCASPIPEYLKFLPNVERITNNDEVLLTREYDLIIILDSGDLKYAGVDMHFRSIKGLPIVINIDHHPTNTLFGHINLVHSKASSTAEIIFHLLDHYRHPITKEVATSLLTGILTDTGGFANLGTTSSSLEVSSRLVAQGARIREVITNTFRNKPLKQLQLWGRALSRLKEDPKTGIVTTVLLKGDFEELGIDEESTEGISNFLNNVEHAKAIIVLREKADGTIKGSLRTTQPDVDVSAIAKFFGGGGHKKAAGFTVKGRIVQTNLGWKIE